MTRLTATLGTSGLAAIFLLGAVQLLPPRDGGTAQAGTETAAAPAWADPPRSLPARPVALADAPAAGPTVRITPQVEIPQAAMPAPMPPAVQPEAQSRRAVRRDREHRRLAARARRPAEARTAPLPAARAAQAPVVRTASARMGGPIGDILHGLGLD